MNNLIWLILYELYNITNIPVIINEDQLMVGRGEFGPVQPWNIGGEQNHWKKTNLISLTKRVFDSYNMSHIISSVKIS